MTDPHDDTSTPPAAISNTLRGGSHQTIIQAGHIRGGVHMHSSAAPPPAAAVVPRQLGAPPAVWVDRAAVLLRLDQARHRPGRTLIVISGPGGIGKTALARRWAASVAGDYPDGQIDLTLAAASTPPLSTAEAQTTILHGLGVDLAHLPARAVALDGLYRTRTATSKLLVLLDHATTTSQVRALLPTSPHSLVIVTSRTQHPHLALDGAVEINLPPFTLDDSLQLLTRLLGAERVQRANSDAAALARSCGGWPLALAVTGARLAARPHQPLTAHTRNTPGSDAVQAALDLTYHQLPRPARALYRRLGVHPGTTLASGTLAALLTLNTGTGTGTGTGTRTATDALLDHALITETAPGCYRMHDIVYTHAVQRLARDEDPAMQETAQRAVLEAYYAAADHANTIITPYRELLPYTPQHPAEDVPVFADRAAALAWFDTHHGALLQAADDALHAGWPALAWHLADRMWPWLLARKGYPYRHRNATTGWKAARQWGKPAAEAEMLMRLGRVCTLQTHYAAGRIHLDNAGRIFGELGDRGGAANAQQLLALLEQAAGNRYEAANLLDNVVEVHRELGNTRALALALLNRGNHRTTIGDHRAALDDLHEALDNFDDTGDVYNRVRVDVALARAYLADNRLAGAEQFATDAAAELDALGAPYESAQAIHVLAAVATQRHNPTLARQHQQHALQLYRSIGAPEAETLAAQLNERP